MWKRIILAAAGCMALASAAAAADMPVKAPPPQPPPAFSWTGFYIGAQVGWVRAHDDGLLDPGIALAPTFSGAFTYDRSNVIGGIHVGANWQWNQWVIGIEGSVDDADVSQTFVVGTCPLFCANLSTTKIGVQGSVRGRLGIAFDRVLIYGTGGVTFADITNTYDSTAFGGGFASIGEIRTGWTAGGGAQYAVTDNWSVRAEYRHTDFGDVVDRSSVAFLATSSVTRHAVEDQVQVGFSYRFGR